MTERTCGNCRWWDRYPLHSYGMCRRNPPMDTDGTVPQTAGTVDRCGEWSDASITPEQEERQELTRRFALAIMSTEWGGDLSHDRLWLVAQDSAAAEPQIQRENEQ